MGNKRKKQLDEAQLKAIIKRQEAEAERDSLLWDRDPQKQYIRRYGWLEVIQDYIKQRYQAGVKKPIKYLTLPGPNASDIGLLWKAGILATSDEGTIPVAICDRKYAALVVTRLNKVGRLLAVGSRYLRQELADGGELRDNFPFDVINLDLCNPFILETKKDDFSTLNWVFRLQRGQSFLLLLTTKPESNPPPKLVTLLQHNISEVPEFQQAYMERFGSDELPLCLADSTFFAQLAFPKAIARLARFFGYGVTEHFAANYLRRSNHESYQMISHSFEFVPLGRNDDCVAAPWGKLKYEPYFSRVPRDAAEEKLFNLRSPQHEQLANEAYRRFITTLLKRSSRNVTTILDENSQLKNELQNEADSLIQWWQKDSSNPPDSK